MAESSDLAIMSWAMSFVWGVMSSELGLVLFYFRRSMFLIAFTRWIIGCGIKWSVAFLTYLLHPNEEMKSLSTPFFKGYISFHFMVVGLRLVSKGVVVC